MTATWTAPRTYVVGELITAAIFNQYLRDEFDWLKTPTASGRVQIAANFTTTSATYTDVTGLTTTMTTNGGGLDVFIRLQVSNSTPVVTSFQLVVDGVSSCILGNVNPTTSNLEVFFFEHVAALAAGSHTIKLQCKCASGTTTIIGTTAAAGDPLFYVREAGA